jgi:hypothetical protein
MGLCYMIEVIEVVMLTLKVGERSFRRVAV